MPEYTAKQYEKAWTGLMVSHPTFGGGIIMRVVATGGKILIPVRFQSGYRKTFTAEEARASLKSLWGRMSARKKPIDQLSDAELQERITEAQQRHDARYQIEEDLEDRLSLAAGIPVLAKENFVAGSALAWAF
ncbi:hypothetical protein [Acidithiobacillus sp.]|uniref:hypothetical protein n=1 Tax=Acidithiobacillus sp. TaxID=1872118 RepID=UPI003D0760A8